MPDVSVARAWQPYVAGGEVQAQRASALNLVDQLLHLRDVSTQHRTEQIKIGLWKWTQAEGIGAYPKFNTRYFSAEVMAQREPAKINHEHVYTMKNHVLALTQRERTKEELRDYLDKYGVACIVTVNEHAELSGSRLDGWERYRETNIEVFDRLERRWLQFADSVATSPAQDRPPAPTPAVDLSQLIEEKCQPETAPLLQRFLRTARLASAAPALARKATGSVSDYFRIHEALVSEPTAAVAYVHWTGKVDFALRSTELPTQHAGHGALRTLKQPVYATSVKIADDASLALAEEMLVLALQKVREAHLL